MSAHKNGAPKVEWWLVNSTLLHNNWISDWICPAGEHFIRFSDFLSFSRTKLTQTRKSTRHEGKNKVQRVKLRISELKCPCKTQGHFVDAVSELINHNSQAIIWELADVSFIHNLRIKVDFFKTQFSIQTINLKHICNMLSTCFCLTYIKIIHLWL